MSQVVKSDNEKSGNFPDLVNAQAPPQYEKSCNALDKPNDSNEENKKENVNSQMDIIPEPADFNLVTQLNQNNPSNKVTFFITKIETNKAKASKNNWKEKTAPNSLPLKKRKRKKVNKDNIVKGALKPPFPHFVKLVEKFGGIKLKRVNLRKVFGGVKTCKKAVELKLYQIICFDKKGKNKSILKNAEPKDEKLFKYLLSRKYKFLFRKYNQKNPTFYIDGEKQTIPGFKHIDEVLENVYKDAPFIEKVRKINKLKIMTSKIVNNFKGLKEYNPQKGGGYEEGFNPEYLESFEENQEIENYSDLDSNNLKKEKEIKDESSLSLSESESESENHIPFKKGSKQLIKKKENAKQMKKQMEHYKQNEKTINSNEMDDIFDFNINQELDEKKEFENDNTLYSFCLKLFNPLEEIVESKDHEMNFW